MLRPARTPYRGPRCPYPDADGFDSRRHPLAREGRHRLSAGKFKSKSACKAGAFALACADPKETEQFLGGDVWKSCTARGQRPNDLIPSIRLHKLVQRIGGGSSDSWGERQTNDCPHPLRFRIGEICGLGGRVIFCPCPVKGNLPTVPPALFSLRPRRFSTAHILSYRRAHMSSRRTPGRPYE